VQDYFILNCKVLGDFRKRAHNFFNGNSFGPAHWDTDKERPAHFYILSVQRDGGGFTGYGISANIKERLAQHRSNLKSAGYSYGSCEIFSGNWGETLQVEREVKVVFETTSKDIKGFRTEATLACNYSEVVAFVQRSKLIQVPTNEKTMYNIVTRRNEYETCMGYRGNEPLDARND
jgi:predicted GIY-YIG superfamily endonuclease